MNISTFSPLKDLPQQYEFSSLRNPRDDGSIQTLWKKVSETIERDNKLSELINQMTRELKKIGERKQNSFDFFPFKLYTVPIELRPTNDQAQFTGSINWRTVRIRGGYVMTNLISTGSYVNGTDRMEKFADYSILPTSSVGNYDIQVPANQSYYWFWVEDSGSIAGNAAGGPYYLRYSANPQTPASPGNPNGWTGFPSASTGEYIIGWCDTNTSAANQTMLTRQIQRTDILSAPLSYFTSSICNNGAYTTYYIAGYPSSSSH